MKHNIKIIYIVVILLFLSGCDFSPTETNNNYNNDGDVNITENFSNLTSEAIVFSESKVYEIQYDVSSIPLQYIENIFDVNDDEMILECFEYIFPDFNIKVESVEHYVNEKISIDLQVFAVLPNKPQYLVHEANLFGLAFEGFILEEMFDTDINDFVFKVKIYYETRLINTITKTLDVDGMITERIWGDFHD